jgi:penicillin-binding protein 2
MKKNTRNQRRKIHSKDKYNREMSSYKDGSTTLAVQGEDINLTLDAELQRYGEQLINKRGGIVAIEPKQERFWL